MEALKKALAEAKERAIKEKGAREKHEARVGEVQQELQDIVKKCKSLERENADQESKLAKARQSAQEAARMRTKSPKSLRPTKAHKRPETKPKAPSRRSKRPKKSRRVRRSLCKANM